MKTKYSVCVKKSARKKNCVDGLIWVKDKTHGWYVGIKERGIWDTRKEAMMHIAEPCETVVEVRG